MAVCSYTSAAVSLTERVPSSSTITLLCISVVSFCKMTTLSRRSRPRSSTAQYRSSAVLEVVVEVLCSGTNPWQSFSTMISFTPLLWSCSFDNPIGRVPKASDASLAHRCHIWDPYYPRKSHTGWCVTMLTHWIVEVFCLLVWEAFDT